MSNIKQQPQIRVIDPESEYFGEVGTVANIRYDNSDMNDHEVDAEFDNGLHFYRAHQFQELTPASCNSTRIGIGDKAGKDQKRGTVVDYYETSYGVWIVLDNNWELYAPTIRDHTPLTEMKEEDTEQEPSWKIGLRNKTLKHPDQDWYISYNSMPDFLSRPTNGPETALYFDEEYWILNGDFRDEYERAFPNLEECKEVFKDNREHESSWSTYEPEEDTEQQKVSDCCEEWDDGFPVPESYKNKPTKVSDCCGAEYDWCNDLLEDNDYNSLIRCKSCGKPCDAVEPEDDDTPTVERMDFSEIDEHVDFRSQTMVVSEVLSNKLNELLEALDKQGIINVDDNQE